MITLLKILPEKWEQAKGYLRLDLEALEAAMNQRWSATFGASNLLNPDTIQNYTTAQTRYIANTATTPNAWPAWDQVNLSNGVKNRLPFSNFVAASTGSRLVGRGSGAAGDFEEISLGSGLAMQGTTLAVDLAQVRGQIPIPDEPYPDDLWPVGRNTAPLDNYREDVWTPVLTFATPGDLSVVYAVQVGSYTRVGNLVRLSFSLETSTFTHTTASGNCNITGLTFAAANITNNFHTGTLQWQGITKANYTTISAEIAAAASLLTLGASGSGQTLVSIATGDMPSAGTVILRGTLVYQAAP
jgi:hypothetical protein